MEKYKAIEQVEVIRKSRGASPSLREVTPGLDATRPLIDLALRGIVWGRIALEEIDRSLTEIVEESAHNVEAVARRTKRAARSVAQRAQERTDRLRGNNH